MKGFVRFWLSCCLLFIIHCSPFAARAQAPAVLRGRVLDTETQQPIPNAQVGVADNKIGTSTNAEGYFALTIPATYQHEKLEVALLGYRRYVRALPPLPGPELRIALQISPATLSDVTVTSSVLSIVREAVARIPQNYPVRPTRLTGFCREADNVQADGRYQYVAEGVVLVGKAPYTEPNDNGTVQILQARKVDLQTRNPLGANFWYAGPFVPHRFDFVHNRLDFINERDFSDYQYRLSQQTEYRGRPVYVVLFGPKPGTARASFEGKMYIDVDSYAFLGAEWHRTPQGIKREFMGSFDATERAYRIDYQQYAGRWHVKSVWYNTLGKALIGPPIHHLAEFVTTAIDTAQFKPPTYTERAQFMDVFRQNGASYDSVFWQNYTTVLPSDALRRALLEKEREEQAAARPLLKQAFGKATISDSAGLQVPAPKSPPFTIATSLLNSLRFSWVTGVVPLTMPASTVHTEVAVGNFRATTDNLVRAQSLAYWRGVSYSFDVLPHLSVQLTTRIAFRQIKGAGYDAGLTYELPFNKRHRPLFLRGGLAYLNQGVAYSLGTYSNSDGGLRVAGTKMSADELRLSLENRTEAIQPKLGVGIELSRRFKLVADASYSLPLRTRTRLLFEETSGFFLFRSDAALTLPASEVALTVNSQPTTEAPWQIGRLWAGLQLQYRVR